MAQLSHPYMTTGETIEMIIQTFVSKVMSLLFNMLCQTCIQPNIWRDNFEVFYLSKKTKKPKKQKNTAQGSCSAWDEQFSSFARSCSALCDPVERWTGRPVKMLSQPEMNSSARLLSHVRLFVTPFTFPFLFHALEKEMATHSSVLAWRIPGTGEPGGLPSVGLHRVGHDWSDLAAAAAAERWTGRPVKMLLQLK